MENQNNTNYGEKLFSWQVDEFDQHERSVVWYVLAILCVLLFLLFAFVTSNLLFAVIVIISFAIIILNDRNKPEKVRVQITDRGVMLNKKFYDFDEFANFSIIDKPHRETRKLFFEFKNFFKNRLSISLDNQDSSQLHKRLRRYLPEDLERVGLPFSETLAKFFKL